MLSGDEGRWLIQRLLLHYLRFQQQIVKCTPFVIYFVYQLLSTIVKKCVLVLNVGQKSLSLPLPLPPLSLSHTHTHTQNSTYKKGVINRKKWPPPFSLSLSLSHSHTHKFHLQEGGNKQKKMGPMLKNFTTWTQFPKCSCFFVSRARTVPSRTTSNTLTFNSH